MSKHKVGLSRTQTALLPPTLDDYAAAGAVVRVIDQYVSGLDLAGLGFTHSVAAHTGASSYAAADLLKLYLYGYFNRLRHSRQLERECKRNVEVMWLLGQLTPCFKTIAAFRSDNAKAFEAVCAQFVAFLREFQLLGGKLPVVAVDGSKFKACASKRSVMTPEQLERERKRIRRYLEEMDEADAHDEGVPELTPEQFEAALEKLKERNKKLEQAQAELAARAEAGAQQGTPRASLTDPDAVLLKGAGAEALAGYNVQQAVEAQHGFIVAHEVTTERNDHTSLAPMAIKAQELTVITDCGYANGAQSQACEELGITPVVPQPQPAQTRAAECYPKTMFSYDAASDSYRCPAGEILTRYKRDQRLQTDYYTSNVCRHCRLRPNCTRSQRRSIARSWHAAAAERAHARATPRLMRLRAATAEHPFGNVKAMLRGGFCLRTLPKVRGEMALAVLTYNLKRALSVLGIEQLSEKLWMSTVWGRA
jgi:transposase